MQAILSVLTTSMSTIKNIRKYDGSVEMTFLIEQIWHVV